MPNIFKRPMFRKGGSTSEGTGITSGLTPRQNYQDQGNVPVSYTHLTLPTILRV
jgi:hypothetical protein